jgi:aspartyl-tRNA(Asn)/glutamyl-tRNA(Gln) amidotransferase subunit A
MCHAAFGSDTGGSVRQPAAFCGQYGFKPTYGLVSRWGLISYASSFDQIGPITRSIADMKLIMEVVSGNDGRDATCVERPAEKYSLSSHNARGYKIGFIRECLEHEGIDPEVRAAVYQKLEMLKAAGNEVEEISFPFLDKLVPVYYVLTTAEASSNLARYSGLTHGHRSSSAKDLESTFRRSRSEGFGPEVKRRIMLGTFVLSAGFYDAYYTKAQKVRRKVKDATDELMKTFDFIVSPTTPTPAFKLGEKAGNPIAMYLADIFTVHANITGNPAISIPAGTSSAGLPIGFQVMGRHFDEARLMDFAAEI